MRLVTWNACRGQFNRKVPLLDALGADIAVIQEIAAPSEQSKRTLWFGDNPRIGVAVVAREPYTLRQRDPLPGAPKYFVPVDVEGPRSFLLFAVWTMGEPEQHRYVRGASTAIDMYKSVFSEPPVVLLGDFNSNAIWDKEHPAELNHSAMVSRLAGHGLVSAYHHHKRESQGSESEPTFYFHRNQSKPFHIDYCFLPSAWAETVESVKVGTFEGWKDHSDHRPLMVEIKEES